MILSFASCNVSVAPVRKEPAHRSEQVTQLLFGEGAEVLEIEPHDWARVRTSWDGYEGWVRSAQLQFLPQHSRPQPPPRLCIPLKLRTVPTWKMSYQPPVLSVGTLTLWYWRSRSIRAQYLSYVGWLSHS